MLGERAAAERQKCGAPLLETGMQSIHFSTALIFVMSTRFSADTKGSRRLLVWLLYGAVASRRRREKNFHRDFWMMMLLFS